MKKHIPFYANPDDTQCYQAALRTILKYYMPDKEFSWQELQKLTDKQEGYWTWPQRGVINLHKMGFEIIEIDTFDTKRFIEEGKGYLVEKFGKDVAKESVDHTKDLKHEQETCKEYLGLKIKHKRLPDLSDIKKYLDNGYLVGVNINSRILNSREGYSGHFVVVYEYDDENLYLQDPGPPPTANRKVPYDLFTKAWEYPNEQMKNLTAFRFKQG